MNKSKVWIITYNYGAIKAGPVLRFMKYAPYFEKLGVETVFVTIDRGQTSINGNENEPKVIYIKCNNSIELAKIAIDKAINEKVKPTTLLFLSIDYQSYFSLLKAKINGIKLLYVSTMQFNLKFKEFGAPRNLLAQFILFFLLNRTYNLFNYIVCSTNLLKNDFKKLSVKDKKLKVIYNGVDTNKFRPATKEEKLQLRLKYSLPTDKFIVLFVGLFVERKGVDYLLNLFREFNRKTNESNMPLLLMIGDEMIEISENSQSFKTNWPKLKQESILDGFVRFDSFSSNIHEYYKMVDMFIFPSKLEGMPNVLLESMASGLPVLVNKFDGFSDDYGISKKEYELLSYEIKNDLKLFENYLNKKDASVELGKNARIHALSNFDFDISIDAYVSLIK
jgi:glycosyltransferase involved in cell wall biosynthesis